MTARCVMVLGSTSGAGKTWLATAYGTWALLPPADQALIHGFVLNKFRGDVNLLSPAPERLLALTGGSVGPEGSGLRNPSSRFSQTVDRLIIHRPES